MIFSLPLDATRCTQSQAFDSRSRSMRWTLPISQLHPVEATLPTCILFKHFPLLRRIILSHPPWLVARVSPETAGLTRFQLLLGKQVKEVTTNPDSLKDQPHPIIYHRLLDTEAYKGCPLPNATSLYEEAQALMFEGGDTVSDTLPSWLIPYFTPAIALRASSTRRTPSLASSRHSANVRNTGNDTIADGCHQGSSSTLPGSLRTISSHRSAHWCNGLPFVDIWWDNCWHVGHLYAQFE